MKTAGIIAEFNPFHNGHKYLIDKVKSDGFRTVCVIGDDFTQRGDTALISKYARAEQALRCGADLCILMPVSWSCSCANNFAIGGISILKSLNIIDTLAFGSECGDTEKLIGISRLSHSTAVNDGIKEELKKGNAFAAARQNAVREIIGSDADILSSPNDTLATEYIAAAEQLSAPFSFYAVRRVGVRHDAPLPNGDFLSASAIRQKLSEKTEDLCRFMPEQCFDILQRELSLGKVSDISRLEAAVLAHLRRTEPEKLLSVPEVSEGLHNKIISAARESVTLAECLEKAKSKRYTMARIKRIIISSFLGIKTDLFCKEVPYIKVLGFNKTGERILNEAEPSVPLITRGGDYNRLTGAARKCFETQNTAADLYALSLAMRAACGNEFKAGIIKL